LRLGCDEERVNESLRMGSTYAVEKLFDGVSDERVGDVDPSNDLGMKVGLGSVLTSSMRE
jgi:hypothetical protein